MNEKIDAILSELGYQRMILGDRAVSLAGEYVRINGATVGPLS